MKRFILAALAATSLLAGGTAANAFPMHGGFGAAHGPVVSHGPVFRAPVAPVVRFGGPGFSGVSFSFGFGGLRPAPERFVDYRAYDLAPPPANFEWVQNGSEALLVNLATGQVVEAVPNAF